MKGWIILAIGVGVLYYLATETNELDKPIAQTEALLSQIENKIDAMTGTQIIKVDNRINNIKDEISDRLSNAELVVLDAILASEQSVSEYKQSFCGSKAPRHNDLSRDNQRFICDKIN
ncbi:hypothetical protein FLM48_22395 [Shewanella sp. Scap07]|uniref:hypothetical protein n=1 Tax=Shewanella sp. Scap07 TaxID=2589987 RepID=UPI0015BF3805|nr:hypothetical protein [Shewanella sp. Scap07]QLE87581.1 hypothetical protein FLM48_22395 [Shewanella sp. Scap07]